MSKSIKKILKKAPVVAPTQDDVEDELRRTGENCSLYITKPAMKILRVLTKSSRRSRSMIVSLFVEKYGPELEKNPAMLMP